MAKQGHLIKKLENKLSSFNGGDTIPVVLIPPKYAQVMNIKGLEIYLKFFKNQLSND